MTLATKHINKVLDYEDVDLINIKSKDKEEKIDTIIPELPVNEEPSIKLDNIKILTKNNLRVMQNLISLTIESFELYKNEFKVLIDKRDQKEVGLLTHKLKLTSNILCAHKLEQAIMEARNLLAKDPVDDLQLQQAMENIQFEFDNCINELQIEHIKLNDLVN